MQHTDQQNSIELPECLERCIIHVDHKKSPASAMSVVGFRDVVVVVVYTDVSDFGELRNDLARTASDIEHRHARFGLDEIICYPRLRFWTPDSIGEQVVDDWNLEKS